MKLATQKLPWHVHCRCLTVPAIWDENHKQAMRRAAKRAGFIRDEDDQEVGICNHNHQAGADWTYDCIERTSTTHSGRTATS